MTLVDLAIGESVVIGRGTKDEVALTITRASSTAVKVGVEAPRRMKIYRDEVLDRGRDWSEAKREA